MLSGLIEKQIHFTYLEVGSAFYKQKDLCNNISNKKKKQACMFILAVLIFPQSNPYFFC